MRKFKLRMVIHLPKETSIRLDVNLSLLAAPAEAISLPSLYGEGKTIIATLIVSVSK